MTVSRAMSSTLKIRALPRGASFSTGRNVALVIAVALFLAVLIVEAAIIVMNAPSATDLGSLYSITT